MGKQGRRATYASLWVLALAIGWIEASVLVYLRGMYAMGDSLVLLPSHLVAVEMMCEACTIVLLAAVACLAGRSSADRAGAFLLSFGIWDLSCYAVLRLVSGWPGSLGRWDILFLIQLPWVAPVWAPATVAAVFMVAGGYLFWTSQRKRRYRWADISALAASALLTIGAFLAEWRAVADNRAPGRFPEWLFWTAVAFGTGWFVRVERRGPAQARA